MKDYSIEPYRNQYRQQLVDVWERSVRATHQFLAVEDIDYFKTIVSGIDFNSFSVFCLVREDAVAGL